MNHTANFNDMSKNKEAEQSIPERTACMYLTYCKQKEFRRTIERQIVCKVNNPNRVSKQ